MHALLVHGELLILIVRIALSGIDHGQLPTCADPVAPEHLDDQVSHILSIHHTAGHLVLR